MLGPETEMRTVCSARLLRISNVSGREWISGEPGWEPTAAIVGFGEPEACYSGDTCEMKG